MRPVIGTPDLSYRAYRVWQRNRDTYLRLWRTELWPPFIEPIMYLLAFGLGLGLYVTNIGGVSYLVFIAPGIVAQSVMFASSFETTYGAFVRMEYQKTFDAIIATPVSIEDVVAGEIFWGTTRGLIAAFAILVIISALQLVSWPSAILVLPISVLSGLMFSSIGMVVTAFVPTINSFNYFITLGLTPMFLVSGVFFPLSGLPPFIQQIAGLSPLTHVVILTRAATTGQFELSMLINLMVIIAIILVTFYFSLRLMSRRLIK